MLPARPFRPRSRSPLSLALASVLLALALPAAAQDTTDQDAEQAKDQQATDLARIQVTGSNIKRTDVETASPVQVISKQEIENMGARTLLQVLDNLPAARPAQQDFRSLFSGSDGASQANLRGLGAQGTLVLLNGRRLSYYGAPAGFQTQFVNIDAIPAAAIERMEVLTDGASAVYGTDAIAGVINVITKRDYQGAEINLTTDRSSRIDSYGEHQASITGGFGDLDRDRYNVYGSVNYYKRDAIPLSDVYDKRPAQYYVNNPNYLKNLRLGAGSKPGEFNPGSYFAFDPVTGARVQEAAPGCNNVLTTEAAGPRCIWQTWMNNEIDGGAQSERTTVYLNSHFLVGDTTEAFAEGTYTDIDLRANGGTPRAFNTTTGNPTSWFSRNTGTTVNQFLYPYLGPNNEYNHASPALKAMMGGVVGLQYLLQDAGDDYFGQRNTDKSYRVVTGLRGQLGQWNWETAFATAGSHSVTYQTVNVNLKGFEKAFGPFTVDPGTGRVIISDHPAYRFGEISQANAALIREAFPTFDIQSWTRLHTLDGKIEGPIAQLPAGEMRAAFGFNATRETFYTPGNPDAANGLITQQGGSWFDGARNTYALFAETVAPLTEKLELDAALRADKYPNFDTNLAPKIGLKYQALPQLMLRGTYSEGFRAPSLAEAGTGGVFAQLGGYRDETRCAETNAIANLLLQSRRAGDVDLGNALLNSDCSRTVARMTQPNKNLQPEKAKIATLGFVFEPVRWLSVSADYWFVYRRNEIVAPDYSKQTDILSMTRSPITDADRANLAQLAAMCADPSAGVACPGTLPGYSVGNVSAVVGQYKNQGKTLIDGFDIDARSQFSLGAWGKLNLGLAATIARRSESYIDEEYRWYYGNTVGYYNNPRLRATLNADWTYRAFTTSLFFNYTGGTKWGWDRIDAQDNNAQTCTAGYLPLEKSKCDGAPSWWTANLSVAWRPDAHWNVGLTLKNLFDRKPFYDPNSFLGDSSDYASIYGRVVSLQAGYKF
ncbi:TonB-dependent receptor [Pseudoxanthomonas winnipegensis]|uniref:TonB-dependent receptor n=1 Tax=Pseudoxanthomonas winnipegensis TaxID=2480810 RepID=A0ABY1WJG9_9GAMM|nr:TonB-dependent receptor [Pseudoxanthomonas winnipegensis]TAA09765.1 TonB-dependent receptor [Pseudoxanthomonas winnipegensis]TAA22856.1 TonB-dependent receptor [Pseudoxanthomonas winnipegensis]TAH73268.1 TonB-dependent receptor [Pseudoxanthomonas winnipegensis]